MRTFATTIFLHLVSELLPLAPFWPPKPKTVSGIDGVSFALRSNDPHEYAVLILHYGGREIGNVSVR